MHTDAYIHSQQHPAKYTCTKNQGHQKAATHTHTNVYRFADFDSVQLSPGWAQQPLGALKEPPPQPATCAQRKGSFNPLTVRNLFVYM